MRATYLSGTGATGKTTIAQTLFLLGYSVMDEVVRDIANTHKIKNLGQIRSSELKTLNFQRMIFQDQINTEFEHLERGIDFIGDRCIIDNMAYTGYLLPFDTHQIYRVAKRPGEAQNTIMPSKDFPDWESLYNRAVQLLAFYRSPDVQIILMSPKPEDGTEIDGFRVDNFRTNNEIFSNMCDLFTSLDIRFSIIDPSITIQEKTAKVVEIVKRFHRKD